MGKRGTGAAVAEQCGVQPSNGDAPDDQALLDAISRQKDHDAFATLVGRHERAAHNLALYLTRDPGTAEEALQEALLRAWRFAHTFVDDGSVRSWLLRIVAHESLRLMRGRIRDRREMTADDPIEAVAERTAPDEETAQDEQLAALRRCVGALPPLERQVVALYYLAGMEQHEIGDALALSQQVVSYRIKEALKRLRAGLTAAGFAAAVPLLDGQGLGVTLGSGAPAPPHTIARALSKIGSIPAGRLAEASARASRRAGGLKWGMSPAITAVLAVAAIGGVVWLSQNEPPYAKTAANLEAVSPATRTSSEAAIDAQDEVVVEEEFDGKDVSPFFVDMEPNPSASHVIAIQRNSMLSLIAGEPGFLVESKYRVYKRAEIRSRWVPLNGKPVMVLFPARQVSFEGPYELGSSIENQDGRILHEMRQKRASKDQPITFELKDASGSRAFNSNSSQRVIGRIVVPDGRVFAVYDNGEVAMNSMSLVPVERIRLHFWIAALGEKGYAIWSSDRIRIVRLAHGLVGDRVEVPEGWHYSNE